MKTWFKVYKHFNFFCEKLHAIFKYVFVLIHIFFCNLMVFFYRTCSSNVKLFQWKGINTFKFSKIYIIVQDVFVIKWFHFQHPIYPISLFLTSAPVPALVPNEKCLCSVKFINWYGVWTTAHFNLWCLQLTAHKHP